MMYWIPEILESFSLSLLDDSLGLIVRYIIWLDRNQK